MADIQFSSQRIEQLWQRKAGQLPQTADAAAPQGELEKALADNTLTKGECPAIRSGNRAYVLHAVFKCRCGSVGVRIYQPQTKEEATMFLAGDPLPPARRVT